MVFDFFKRVFNSNKVEIELNEIQSLILRSRPVPYFGTAAAIEVKNSKAGRAFIKAVLPYVLSSEDWHHDVPVSICLSFTYKGLKALGLPQESLDSFPDSFKEGMAARADRLVDVGVNNPINWEKTFKDGNIHIVATILANSKEVWQQSLETFNQNLGNITDGISVVFSQSFGADKDAKNVFGFRDGISQPEVEGSGIDNPPAYDRPIKAGEFILGYPGEAGVVKPFPQPEVLGKNGSFMFFRKYQAQVAEFNRFIKDNTNTPEEGELLAAKLIGRWRSGAPLVLTPDKDNPELGGNNDFSYKDDELGKKCPFGSHTRRMNPRDSKSFVLEDANMHRVIRRGLSFGDIVPPEVTKNDGKERGAYFIGISADAMGTLEFLQKQWINNGNSMNLGEEKDPMLGVQDNGLFTRPDDPLVKRYHGLQTYNIVKGGEYCFIPSLSALKWISELT